MTTRQPSANGTAVRLKTGLLPGTGSGSMSVTTTNAVPTANARGAAHTASPYRALNQAMVQAPAVSPCQMLNSVASKPCATMPIVAGYWRRNTTATHAAVANTAGITGREPPPCASQICSSVPATSSAANSQSR